METTQKSLFEEKESIYPKDLRGFKVGIKEEKFKVYELLNQYYKEDRILNVISEDKLVWSENKMSRFIESVILDLPIPALFFSQTVENKNLIIDGQQRILTLLLFTGKIKEKNAYKKVNFRLTGLKGLPYLNGKNYQDLKEHIGLQAKIESKLLDIFLFQPSVKINIIYDILKRINARQNSFEEQKIRNVIIRGKATNLL
ncbi:DUF262 domain-containing protein [Bernardetia sp. OM2101]|uniref:DUF262 domain-containing protein n=1 Tax=Bernardetia sp. OM2101 TaxID=3344876 RepID=UPI0035D11DCA